MEKKRGEGQKRSILTNTAKWAQGCAYPQTRSETFPICLEMVVVAGKSKKFNEKTFDTAFQNLSICCWVHP